MATTPLIKKLTGGNGIFYAFQSGVNDSDLCNASNGYRFAFSKYALLNIPNIKKPTIEPDADGNYDISQIENTVQFEALGNTVIGKDNYIDTTAGSETQTKYLAESFQNYCLNMEAVLMSQDTFDAQYRKRSVSERVFFKWLKEMGAIRYISAKDGDYYTGTGKRFVEERRIKNADGKDSKYNTVVKYVNDIQAVYSNTTDCVSTELYIYIPTEQGSSPYVLFEPVSDNNYHYYTTEGTDIYNEYTNPYLNTDPNQNVLCGRKTTEGHPTGLVMEAFYDNDNDYKYNPDAAGDPGVKQELLYSSDGSTDMWYKDSGANAYYTDIAASDSEEGNYFNAVNQIYRKSKDGKSVTYVRPTLDGVSIDFNIKDYKLSNPESSVDISENLTLNDLNIENGSENFEFNAILVYYDLINTLDPNDKTTNLYGVYFMNNVKNEVGDSTDANFYLMRDVKYKPSAITTNGSSNGNALAYKINFKTDTSFENAETTRSVNTRSGVSGNTFSMDLFIDVMTAMKTMSTTYAQNLETIKNVSKEIDDLKDVVVNSTNTIDIEKRLDKVENSLNSLASYVEKPDTFMAFVSKIYDDYNEIIHQIETSKNITLTYSVNSGVINSMVEHNQSYNIDSSTYATDLSLYDNYTIPLKRYTNYLKHKTNETSYVERVSLTNDLNIYIDDSDVQWKTGQTFRLVFGDEFDPGYYRINIYTDKGGKGNGTEYGVVITGAGITLEKFVDSNYKPIFEIICIDSTNMIFDIDQIK